MSPSRSGSASRVSAPLASNKHSVTCSPFDVTAKFVPFGPHVAPSGAGRPGKIVAVIGSPHLRLVAEPPPTPWGTHDGGGGSRRRPVPSSQYGATRPGQHRYHHENIRGRAGCRATEGRSASAGCRRSTAVFRPGRRGRATPGAARDRR